MALINYQEGIDHPIHVAAGQVMGLQLVDGDLDASLHGLDEGIDDPGGHHAAQAQADRMTVS